MRIRPDFHVTLAKSKCDVGYILAIVLGSVNKGVKSVIDMGFGVFCCLIMVVNLFGNHSLKSQI